MENNVSNQTKVRYDLNKQKLQEVLSEKKISSSAKLLLLYLRSRLGGKKVSWPSQKRIAKDLGLSDRQVRNLLTELKKYRIIRWIRGGYTEGKDTKTRSNKYDLSSILTRTTKEILKEQDEEDVYFKQIIKEEKS